MDFYNEHDEDEELISLIGRFDKMLQSGDYYFFDVDEFEQVIDHYLINNQLDKSDIAIRYALEQHPRSSTFMLRQAQLLISKNKINKALDLLAEVEEMEPENTDVFLTKAGIYSQLKRYEKAIE